MNNVEEIGKDISWTDFEGSFVKLEDSESKDLVLSNWRQVEKEFGGKITQAIEFDVEMEDGLDCEKSFSVTSKKMAMKLKPIIDNAEKMKSKSFKVRLLKTGSGYKTEYSVKTLD